MYFIKFFHLFPYTFTLPDAVHHNIECVQKIMDIDSRNASLSKDIGEAGTGFT
jgi:hypothetical protein